MSEATTQTPSIWTDADALAREIVARVGKDIRLALPLGLGKPVTLVNALTRLACEDRSISLKIFTALTLERPTPSSDLEERFLGPALDRLFGAYPAIDYAVMLRRSELPENIEVREFFFLAGSWLGVPQAQQNYISANYTHALDVLLAHRPNLLLQLLARDDDRLSLSCNTDVTADLLRMRRAGELDFLMAGEVNDQLPFMAGEGEAPAGDVALLLEPAEQFELFSAVKRPVSRTDHAIGLHVSRLVADGGTLQIGIGEVGDAVAHALILRERAQLDDIWAACPFPHDDFQEHGRFETGLHAVTEMLADGILRPFAEGVVRREVDGAAIHAGFFVECRDFYRRLRELPPERRAKIAMRPVSFTNQLYGDEEAKRAARRKGRFINAAMKATLLGAVVSDQTEDGQVVSGVGGQFNFVEQAFALKDARAIITLPATRGDDSNIVWSYGHATVPRHMRDIVVTEYGVADLRGKTDAEVVAALLSVADSRFQPRLLDEAKSAGKLPQDYEISEAHRQNRPEAVESWLGPFDDRLPSFPSGTDFDEVEQRLLPALAHLKEAQDSTAALARLALEGRGPSDALEAACLERMSLSSPHGLQETTVAAALKAALRRTAQG